MKNRELIKLIENAGCVFLRHGGEHDIYERKSDNVQVQIPRHKEINERTATSIKRRLGIK